MNKRIKTLLIEDNRDFAELVREMLSAGPGPTFVLQHVDRLSTGLERLRFGDVDVVLLDLTLFDSEELETIVKMQSHAPDVPVAVLTGLDDEWIALKALQKGGAGLSVQRAAHRGHAQRVLSRAIERHNLQLELRRRTQQLQASEIQDLCYPGRGERESSSDKENHR